MEFSGLAVGRKPEWTRDEGRTKTGLFSSLVTGWVAAFESLGKKSTTQEVTRVTRHLPLISLARPEILSTARAIWSRQRAITAGRAGSISLSGTGPTSWDAFSQRPDASGSQWTDSARAARPADGWNCRATCSRLLRACSA